MSITIFINNLPLEVEPNSTISDVESKFKSLYPDEMTNMLSKIGRHSAAIQEILKEIGPHLVWRNDVQLDGTVSIESIDIQEDEMHLPFYKIIAHRATPSNKIVTNVLGKGKILAFEETGLSIQFHSTFRIPNNGNIYPLPPALSNLKLFGLGDNAFVLPMWQREAMWMSFHMTDNKNCGAQNFCW